MLGLRQGRGMELAALRQLEYTLPDAAIAKWEKIGMLRRAGDALSLVGEGWIFLDEIGADLMSQARKIPVLPGSRRG